MSKNPVPAPDKPQPKPSRLTVASAAKPLRVVHDSCPDFMKRGTSAPDSKKHD